MLQHILVPLDGSWLAQTALDYALNALGTNGKLTLVTVLQQPDVPIYDFYPVTMHPQTKTYELTFTETVGRATEYLKRLADDIQAEHSFEVHTIVEVGDAATVLVETAEKLHVDAILMSTHGRSGLSRWLFGSVTQKVLAASSRPVFVVPAKASDEVKKTSELRQAQPSPN